VAKTKTILVLAFLARAFVLWFVMVRYAHDWLFTRGIELGILAQSIVAGQGLSSPFGGTTGPTALLAPGYPALIACVFAVFGSFSPASAMAIMVLQLGFTLLTVFLIVKIAQHCFGGSAANLAGFFWAISLPLIWMPTIFWETCLSALLLLGMVGLAIRFEPEKRSYVWLGAYAGLGTLVNPALLLSFVAILIWMAWRARSSMLPAWLAMLLVFAPWPIRNARVLHAFIPLRSTLGLELWMGNRPGARGYLDPSIFPLFSRSEFNQYEALGEVRYMADKTSEAEAAIAAHPGEFLRLSSVRYLRFWSGTGTEDGSAWFALHALLTTSLGGLGLVRLWREGHSSLAVLFILPLFLFPLPYYVTHAEFRYRLVLDPILTILGSYALANRVSG
jgi:hypothetical protein